MRPAARFLGSTLALLALASIAAPPARPQACDAAPRVRLEFDGIQAAVGVTLHAFVSAHDPNGTAIASLTFQGASLPAGHDATLVPNASNTAGEFTWTPQPGQAGIYHVPILATNSLTGSASLQIQVVDTGGAPFVTAPEFVQANEGSFVTFEVYAGDPDGAAIDALTASVPPGATFTPNASNTQGTFAWNTGFGSGGSWPVSFTAANDRSWTTSTTIQVVLSNRPPVISVPGTVVGTEGVPLTICAEAFDADGDPLDVFTVSPQLPGVQIVPSPTNEVLAFTWTPQPGQAGSYLLSFFAASEDGSTTQIVSLTILSNSDRAPVVGAPAAVSGTEGNPLAVNVTASDPDGDAISSLTADPLVPGMTFAANGTNTAGTLSWTPSAGEAGTYFVVFTAANALTGSATTQINVAQELFTTLVFTVGGNKTLRLGSGKPQWCLYVEPVNSVYSLSDIDLSTVVLRSPGTGSVEEIHAIAGKTSVAGDRNMNDVPDLEICFAKEDLL
ncbi:MAG TPA: Ig-like domain-containing protein, partial [Acidobacteriota bacterium]|nr:Ig-like domain-containing protein [Acidobacteriota bacterium]